MGYFQKRNPAAITSCGRRRIERVKSIYNKTNSKKPSKLKIKSNGKI